MTETSESRTDERRSEQQDQGDDGNAIPDNLDEAKGRAKRAVGELTDDQEKKDEGTIDKLAGNVKSAVDSVAGKAKDLVDDDSEEERKSG